MSAGGGRVLSEDALLVASFEGGELHHDVDRVLGLRLRLVLEGDNIVHPDKGADWDDILLIIHPDKGPGSLTAARFVVATEEDPAGAAASAIWEEFMSLRDVWDGRFRSVAKLSQ